MLIHLGKNLRFSFSWQWTFLSFFFILFFLRLSYWQIQRFDEKTAILLQAQKMTEVASSSWNVGDQLPLPYQKIILKGQWQKEVFLLDNQIHNHEVGFDVLSPLELLDGHVVLVDRGWIKAESLREKLPNLARLSIPDKKASQAEIAGSVYYPSTKLWTLGPLIEPKNQGLTIVEQLNVDKIADYLQEIAYPFVLRLAPNDVFGYIRDWPLVAMPPMRHQAYALQWFLMALVILILYFSLNLKFDAN